MSSLTLATLLHASILATGEDSYADAHREAEAGKPLVVMVSAEWCGPCQQMKKYVIPQVRSHGLFQKVAFTVVNVDRQQKLARQLTGGGSIPQLIMYRKTTNGWKRRKLVGGQSVDSVEKFINQGIAMDETEREPASAEGGDQPPQEDKTAAGAPATAEIRTVSLR